MSHCEDSVRPPDRTRRTLGVTVLVVALTACGGPARSTPGGPDFGNAPDRSGTDGCPGCGITAVFPDARADGPGVAVEGGATRDSGGAHDALAADGPPRDVGERDAAVCDRRSCGGCCAPAGECVETLSDERCGPPGEPCRACDAAQRCEPSTGKCERAQQHRYRITIVSAEIDGRCGALDTCDPYALVSLGTLEARTDWIEDDMTPRWNHFCFSVTEDELAAQPLRVRILDDDDLIRDEAIGSCDLAITTRDISSEIYNSGPCDKRIKNIQLQLAKE